MSEDTSKDKSGGSSSDLEATKDMSHPSSDEDDNSGGENSQDQPAASKSSWGKAFLLALLVVGLAAWAVTLTILYVHEKSDCAAEQDDAREALGIIQRDLVETKNKLAVAQQDLKETRWELKKKTMELNAIEEANIFP